MCIRHIKGDLTVADTKTNKRRYVRGKTYERVMMIFVLLAVIAVGAGIIASITMFNKFARVYREDTLKKVVRLAASEINPDKIDVWLANGSDKDFTSCLI